ncbi:MAG: 3-dehydroquinate synthase, partial [Oscillospiraceae bacterium]|nr:3-dehydroquinate synthase [Oscillospiraceae bacterium]
MRTVHVSASRCYDIHIGPGILARAGEWIKPLCPGGLCAIVTDDIVDGLYAEVLETSLRTAGLRAVKFVFPNGEQGKNAQNYLALLEFLAENRLTRADCVTALGGGVPGDLAGFAAAT